MRRLLRLLELAAFVTCVVAVLAALALVPLERSGALLDMVQAEVDRALGEGRAQVAIGSARLHWSDPGLRLRDIRLIDREAASGAGELIRIEELRAQISIVPPGLRRVAIIGGVVTASPTLAEVLASIESESDGEQQGDGGAAFGSLPQLLLRDVELLLSANADEPARPIGRVELRVESDRSGQPRIEGSLTPRLGPPDKPTSPLRFAGRIDGDDRVALATSAVAIPVSSAALPSSWRVRAEEFGAWIAGIDVEGELTVDLTRLQPLDGELRARVADLRGPAVETGPLPTDAVLDLQARLAKPPEAELVWARDLGLLGTLRGRWRGADLRADLAVGADAPPAAALDLQLLVERLPIGPAIAAEALSYLDALPRTQGDARNVLEALDLDGAVNLRAAAAIARRANPDDPAPEPQLTLVADPTGSAQLTFQGFPDRQGVRHGFPVTAVGLRGRAVHIHDGARERSDLTALIGLTGDHPSGSMHADLSIISPGRSDGPWPRVRMDLAVPAIDVATDLVTGVDGLGLGSFDLRRTFAPSAGTARGRVLLDQPHQRVEPVLAVDLEVQDAAVVFDQMPAPLHAVEGSVQIRWSDGTATIAGTENDDRPRRRRAIGLAFEFGARADDGSELTVRGAQRDPSLAELTEPERYPSDRHGMIDGTHVTLRGATADGPIVAALAERLPNVETVLSELAPAGAADASFARVVANRRRAGRQIVEVTPTDLQVGPQDILLDGVAGWLRVDGELPPGRRSQPAPAGGDSLPEPPTGPTLPPPTIRGSFGATLVAAGPGPTPVASDIAVAADLRPSSAGARISGLELDDRVLHSELTRTGLEGAATVRDSLEALDVDGPVDITFAVRLDATDGVPDQARGVVHLRENRLLLGGVRATDLRGVLSSDGTRIDAPVITADVRGVDVELRDGFGGPPEELARSDADAARLLQNADSDRSAQLAFGGVLSFEDAELSPRVLADYGLAPPATDPTGPVWEDPGDDVAWQLFLDADRARFVGAIEPTGPPTIAIGGSFVPHDVRIGAGLQLDVTSAQLNVPHAVIEGGSVRALAQFDEAYGQLGNWRLSDLESTLSYVQGRLTFDGLAGGFAGGTIGPFDAVGEPRMFGSRALSVELREPYSFDLAIGFEEVQVRELLDGVVPGGDSDRGKLRGDLRIAGNPGDPLGLEGSGFVALEDARLFSIPVVRELFNQLGLENVWTFDWMRSQVLLRDGELVLTDATAHSPIVRLVGGGTLGLDGRLHQDFELTYSLVDQLGILSRIVYGIQNELVRVAVRGDMTRPRVVVSNSLINFILRWDRRRPPSLPYPSRAAVPERF